MDRLEDLKEDISEVESSWYSFSGYLVSFRLEWLFRMTVGAARARFLAHRKSQLASHKLLFHLHFCPSLCRLSPCFVFCCPCRFCHFWLASCPPFYLFVSCMYHFSASSFPASSRNLLFPRSSRFSFWWILLISRRRWICSDSAFLNRAGIALEELYRLLVFGIRFHFEISNFD